MNFKGIEIDVLSQTSIDAAKSQMPSQGVGPSVASELLELIGTGQVTSFSQLPREYSHLGRMANLPA